MKDNDFFLKLCVCVCVCEGERERKMEIIRLTFDIKLLFAHKTHENVEFKKITFYGVSGYKHDMDRSNVFTII